MQDIRIMSVVQSFDFLYKVHNCRIYVITCLLYDEYNIRFAILLHPGTLVLLRNNAKDGRKGDKLVKRWLGPYKIAKHLNKGVYILENRCTGQILKKAVNSCRYSINIITWDWAKYVVVFS